jgi:hypothetical protein
VSAAARSILRSPRGRVVLALALAAAYALPLFVPPPPVPPAVPEPDWTWLQRIVPGVPPAWVGLRLAALALAALLLASVVRAPVARLPAASGTPSPGRAGPVLWAALLLAGLHAAYTLAGPDPGRAGQALHLLVLFAPAALLAGAALRGGPGRAAARGCPAGLLPAGVVVAVWSVLAALAVHGSLRPADVVDTWSGLDTLARAAADSRNLLRESDLPGVPGTYLFLQGVAWMGPGRLPADLGSVQLVHLLWLAGAGMGVGWLATRIAAPSTAPVASAALLFAPFTLLIPFQAAPFFLGIVMTTAMLAALVGVHAGRSPAALAALGATLGLAVSMPPVWPMAACIGALAVLSLARRPRLPPAAIGVAGLCLVSGGLPGLPDSADLAAMTAAYTEARGSWVGLELLVMGQFPPNSPSLWQLGEPAWFDIPLASLLAPFVVPRTPLRLWGDALFDPVATVLSAFGIAVCLRHAWRHPASFGLLLLLAVGLAPGFVSSFDRPSHTRLFTAPVPLALLAAVGLEALRRALAPRGDAGRAGVAAALGVALVVALSGSLLFHRVTPSLLAQSSLGIALRALGERRPEGGAAVLAHPPPQDTHWLYVHEIAGQVPDPPLPVLVWDGGAVLGARKPEVVFWSPGLELDEGVAEAVCARWPGAVVYRLWDPVGVSSSWAARRAATAWTPALPAGRWQQRACPGPRG